MNENTEIKVSIIVPVYNTEKYLCRCLDSICNQTFNRLEIICVDDGSTDSSLLILEDYVQRDSRIKILKQHNRGGGAARNYGLQYAQGDYVLFLDSDDFFHPSFVEAAYYQAVAKAADIVIVGGKAFDCSTGKFSVQEHYLRKTYFENKEVVSAEELSVNALRITNSAPWNKLFRKEFILDNQLYFQEISNSNDVFFVLMALFLGKRITYVDRKLVYYRKNHGGNIQSKKSKEPLAFYQAYMAVRDELIKRGMFERFEQAWINITVEGFSFNITTITGKKERDLIYNVMTDEPFVGTGILEHPDNYYFSGASINNVKGFLCSCSLEIKRKQNNSWYDKIVIAEKYRKNVPDVSVVIPVYNSERYLEKTLKSIIEQSYRNIEIICINDGSTDHSISILLEYAAIDDRISVYSQQNRGLSATRNLGIRVSRGKYIYFMDSDDLLEKFALETLYYQSIENDLDIIFFDADSFADTEEDIEAWKKYDGYYCRKNQYPSCINGLDMFKLLIKNNEYRASACLQMIKREYLLGAGIAFQEGILYEDNIFSTEVLMKATKVGYCGLEFFHRRVRENSIMTQKIRFHNAYSYFRCYLNLLEMTNDIEIDYETACMLEKLLQSYKSNVKRFYSQLEEWEKKSVYGLPLKERALLLELCK